MTPLDEQLSRLWDGDLPEAEARALRDRIGREPEVARRWERLRAALAALAALPAERTPPPLRAARPAKRSWAGLVPWALAAAAVVLWLRSWPEPDRVLVAGTEWIDGEAQVLAGDVIVEVDGRVQLLVEPAGGVPRGGGADEEDPMWSRSTVVAAVAGAVVTVVVYEGTAVVRAESGAPVVVEAGDRYRTGGSPAAAPAPAAAPGGADEDRQERLARLQAELAAAQEALAAAEFEGALTRGQLEAMQGVVSEWPADAPEPLTPDAFRAGLEATLASLPDAKIAEIDCSEYPCLAAIAYTGEGPAADWFTGAEGGIKGWIDTMNLPSVSMSVNTSRFRDDEGHDESYLIFGAHSSSDEGVGTRTKYRLDGLVEEIGSRLGEE